MSNRKSREDLLECSDNFHYNTINSLESCYKKNKYKPKLEKWEEINLDIIGLNSKKNYKNFEKNTTNKTKSLKKNENKKSKPNIFIIEINKEKTIELDFKKSKIEFSYNKNKKLFKSRPFTSSCTKKNFNQNLTQIKKNSNFYKIIKKNENSKSSEIKKLIIPKSNRIPTNYEKDELYKFSYRCKILYYIKLFSLSK